MFLFLWKCIPARAYLTENTPATWMERIKELLTKYKGWEEDARAFIMKVTTIKNKQPQAQMLRKQWDSGSNSET